jgi:hypothetical protein
MDSEAHARWRIDILAGIEITIEAWKVAAGSLYPDAVPG